MGAEISDAALEGVSGGCSEENLELARRICAVCFQEKPGCCYGGSPENIADAVGAGSEFYYNHCRYFKDIH